MRARMKRNPEAMSKELEEERLNVAPPSEH
jgi:hypothetical protein